MSASTHVARTYCTSRGVETRYVLAAPGHATHVLTASGRPIDVTSGAAVAARREARVAPALRTRLRSLVARVDDVEAARTAARERAEAAERMWVRRVANNAIAAYRKLKEDLPYGKQELTYESEVGDRPGVVWRAAGPDEDEVGLRPGV